MGRRDFFLQPICWPLCCGCLPVYGVLKGLLCAIFCVPVLVVANTVIAFIFTFPHFYRTYRAVIQTPKLGPNIKTLILLSLWAPLILWIPIVFLCSFVFGIFYPPIWCVMATFDDDENVFLGGVATVFSDCCYNFIKKFATFNNEDYPAYLEDFRTVPRRIHTQDPERGNVEVEEPFDVPLYWIPLGLFISFVGVIVDFPAALAIGVIKFIPAVIKTYYELWRHYCKMDALFMALLSAFFVFANLLVVPVLLIGLVLFMIFGILLGAGSTGTGYRHGCKAGFCRIIHNIYEMDNGTNQLIFDAPSCLPCLKLCTEDVF